MIGGNSNDWYSDNLLIKSVPGIANNGSFDADSDRPAFVFSETTGSTEKGIAETISHEVGHTLGLYHDGTTTFGDYYQGAWRQWRHRLEAYNGGIKRQKPRSME